MELRAPQCGAGKHRQFKAWLGTRAKIRSVLVAGLRISSGRNLLGGTVNRLTDLADNGFDRREIEVHALNNILSERYAV